MGYKDAPQDKRRKDQKVEKPLHKERAECHHPGHRWDRPAGNMLGPEQLPRPQRQEVVAGITDQEGGKEQAQTQVSARPVHELPSDGTDS